MDQIAERVRLVDFPIELALPPWHEEWKIAWSRAKEMFNILEKSHASIATVHGTQGKLNRDSFLEWGKQTIMVAERLGARTVTVHPNRVKKSKKADSQQMVRDYLRLLQSNKSVTVAIETFAGAERIFTPEETMSAGIPMTLDTAHLHDDSQVFRIIGKYWQNIPVVHLSARGEDGQHLPIDGFCIEVVRKLVGLGWSGTITLEYLRQYHHRLKSDIKAVQEVLAHDVTPDVYDNIRWPRP